MLLQTAPASPPPVPVPTQVTVDGTPIANSSDIYQAFRAQRRELSRQMEDLQSTREEISGQLALPTVTGADRKGLESRITSLDQRIDGLDKQIADADAQVAKAAAIPGAAVDPPQPPRSGPPEEVFVLGGMMIIAVLLPLTVAYSRRIWRRGAKVVTSIPKELIDRLANVEQTVEATAVEIERIGEGQRFMTRIFTESQNAKALPATASQPPAIRP